MFLNIQIDLIIWKPYDQQFTLKTKKPLHIIFNCTGIVEVKIQAIRYSHVYACVCIQYLAVIVVLYC